MDPKKLAEDILDELFPQQEVVNEEAEKKNTYQLQKLMHTFIKLSF